MPRIIAWSIGMLLLIMTIAHTLAATPTSTFLPTFNYNIPNEASSIITFNQGDIAFTSLVTNAGQHGPTQLTYYRLTKEPVNRYLLALKVYQYVSIEANVSANGISNLVDFNVSASWLDEYSVGPQKIRLYLFNETWKELDTQLLTTNSSSKSFAYRAGAQQFGYFAIAIKESPLTEKLSGNQNDINNVSQNNSEMNVTPIRTVYPLPTPPQVTQETIDWMRYIAFALMGIALIGICVVTYAIVQRVRQKNQPAGQSAIQQHSKREIAALKDAKKLLLSITHPNEAGKGNVTSLLANIQKKYQHTQHTSHDTKNNANSPVSETNTKENKKEVEEQIEDVSTMSIKLAQLEHDVVKKFMDHAKEKRLSEDQIRQELLAHGVREELIEAALEGHLI